MAEKRDIPGVIAPPPLIALAAIVAGLLLDWLLPAYVLTVLLNFGVRIVFGVLLIAAGAGLALAGERRFSRAGTEVRPWRPSTALVTGGVYAYVRNPMYVGMALAIAGIAVALASDWMLVLTVAFLAVIHLGVVRREERYLEAKFGDAYRRYRDAVPRYGWPG